MTLFNGKQIFYHVPFRFNPQGRLQRIMERIQNTVKRRKLDNNHVDDEVSFNITTVDDDQSSVENPTYPETMDNPSDNPSSSNSDTDATDANRKLALSTPPAPAPEHHLRKKGSPLLLLPQELFDMITSYLNHPHIVLLAILNKELFDRFMYWCVKVGIRDSDAPPSYKYLNNFMRCATSPGMSRTRARGVFLSQLEYDMDDVVYCYKCKKIHSPFVSFMDRAHAPAKSLKCTDCAMEHHMPSRATRKLLRVVTKRRIHGVEYRHLMQQVNNTSTAYVKGIMAQVALRMRYRDNELCIRRQQVISSIDKTALAMWLFSQQLHYISAPSQTSPALPTPVPTHNTFPQVYVMCNHRNWHTTYMSLLSQLVGPLCSNSTDDLHSRHTAACFSSEPHDVSKQEGHIIYERLKWLASGAQPNPMDTPALLGDVLGCDKCTTDFSLDVIALPEPFGWGFVLTSWLDLGALDFSAKWDSHRDAKPNRMYRRDGAAERHGDICRRFEDLSSPRDYRARVGALDLERMQNYGWGRKAAEGRDKYVTWTQSHSCNPRTGWIEDPDPLEEADY
ncbi:hypothetical protein GGR53DRAFT_479221 [Hypoxylon sp. FL1150]|nr:hypothetical protein GGR53DRAFT_479221 [Hypoxylon sp. FL1150]